jgi:hypothetical protein
MNTNEMFRQPDSLLSYRKFTHGGIAVEEFVILWGEKQPDIVVKLLWVRPPFNSTTIDRKPNPICHVEFPISSYPQCLEVARLGVQDAFEDYWKLPTQSPPEAKAFTIYPVIINMDGLRE